MKRLFYTSALAALLTVAVPAYASLGITATQGDLLVGFKTAASTQNLVIDLGSVSTYWTTGTELNLGNFSAALDTYYGGTSGSWATTTGTNVLNWGVADTAGANPFNGEPAKTAWVSKAWGTTAGTLGVKNSTAYSGVLDSILGTGASNIGKAYTGANSGSMTQVTGHPNAGTIAVTDANSWNAAATTGSVAFGISNLTQAGSVFYNQASRTNLGGMASVVDLYALEGGGSPGPAGKFFGTLALFTGDYTDSFGTYHAGDLVFTPIPEPSTFGMILGAAALGFVMIRRRRQALA